MYFLLELVSGPAQEVITLEEMRRHLRLFEDINDEDPDIEDLIVGAREWVEHYTGRGLIDQTWRLTLTGSAIGGVPGVGDAVSGYSVSPASINGAFNWSGGGIPLRRSPVLGITSIATVATDGVETVLESTIYEVRGAAGKYPEIVMLNGSSLLTGVVRIVFRVGYADQLGSPQQGPEMVPKRFKQAMKLWAESVYDREPDLIEAAEMIIKPERAVVPIG